MNDRGAALRTVLADELPEAWNGLKWEQHEVAHYFRSICEHLGITWDDVDLLRDGLAYEQHEYLPESIPAFHALSDKLATLLEAAGIER